MREIKFRAWDGERMWLGIPVWGNAIHPDTGKDKYDWELMQYTGLKDKSGKEIYEGDIVSGKTIETFNHEVNSFTASVEWDDSDTGFFYATDIFNVPHLKTYYAEDIEVIGNIYKNENLLTPPSE